MQQLNHFSLALTKDCLDVRYQNSWDDEDIEQLADQLLHGLPSSRVLERIPGADRMNIRFSYLNANFVLNYEVYSQSCWLEIESGGTGNTLAAIFQHLKVNG